MKRVILAAVLLGLVVGFNIYCLDSVTKTKDEVYKNIEDISASLSANDLEKAASECEEFAEYWLSESRSICRVVRHELIDRMTASVSRLSALAEYGELGELSAELDQCRTVMGEIWDSERPFLGNIF